MFHMVMEVLEVVSVEMYLNILANLFALLYPLKAFKILENFIKGESILA